jgi:CBS domain-containing protein
MRKNHIKSGDILLIPVNGERCAVAKIIYVSRHFKNVILLNVYPLVVSVQEMPELPIDAPHDLLIYTAIDKIQKEEWKKIDNIPVTNKENLMSKRIVGGEVWIEDNYIGYATEEDCKTLKQMNVAGTKLAEEKIKIYLANIIN